MNTDPITLARVVLRTHVERDWRPLDGINLGGTVCDSCRRPWPCHFTDLARAVLAVADLADELDREGNARMEDADPTRAASAYAHAARIRTALNGDKK